MGASAGVHSFFSGPRRYVLGPWSVPRAGEPAEEEEEEEKGPLPSLDVFLSRYTSEDNASFQEIMEVAKEKSRARHAWLYQAEEEQEKVPWGAAVWALAARCLAPPL